MATISLCMIVKNEEETLGRCLSSVMDLVDEIIIVDTGSTDRTREIAYSFTNHVYDFTWVNDFSAARNYSFSKATMDYQFWLDADDILLEDDRKAFKKLKENLQDDVDMVLMKYNYHNDVHNNPLVSFHRERLFKTTKQYQWSDCVHEFIQISDNYIISDIAITHKRERHELSGRNLKIYEQQLANNIPFTPRMLFYYARELRDHGMDQKAIEYFHQFLTTRQGLIDDNISACLEIGKLFRKLNEPEKALEILYYSFNYKIPQAEIACEIANIYQQQNEYAKAIYWYELVLSLKQKDGEISFVNHDSHVFIPAIELCVCHYHLGDNEKAIYYNELAGSIKETHPSVISNRNFFGVNAPKKSVHFITEMARLNSGR